MSALRTNKKRKHEESEETKEEVAFQGIIDVHNSDSLPLVSRLISSKPQMVVFNKRSGSSQHVLCNGSRTRFILCGKISSIKRNGGRFAALIKVDEVAYACCKSILAQSVNDTHGALSSWTQNQRTAFYDRTLYESASGNKFTRVHIPSGVYKSGERRGKPLVNLTVAKGIKGISLQTLGAHTVITTVCRAEVWNDHAKGEEEGFSSHGRPTLKFITTHIQVNAIEEPSEDGGSVTEESIDDILSLVRGKLHGLRKH